MGFPHPAAMTPMARLADLFPDTPADAVPLRAFDWAQTGVALPYVIFITGRCGSTLLTRLLAATGLCGNPDELFKEEGVGAFAREWGATDFPAYFQAAVRHTASNRRFGFEIDPFRFQQLRELISFPEVFAPRRSVFFWMTRRDIVSQGWSYAKAKKTGLWHRYADGSEKRLVPIGGEGDGEIGDSEWWREIILALTGERIVEDFFAASGITPYRLDYEMLIANRHRTVVDMLLALSCGPDEIAQRLGALADHTERNTYADGHDAMIRFCDRYRNELRQIDRHRVDIDIETLRRELSSHHHLVV